MRVRGQLVGGSVSERVNAVHPSVGSELDAVPSDFVAFFDDAAVFPPGLAELEVAISDHLARRGTPFAAAIGPLVLPLSAVQEASVLASRLNQTSQAVQVSVVVPPGLLVDALAVIEAVSPHLTIVAIELKTNSSDKSWQSELQLAAGRASDVQLFVELSSTQVTEGALALLTASGAKLKFRTGGIEAHLFPSAEELAAVLRTAVDSHVPFKLTAGLHRSVRYDAPATGFAHHGFLNIAVATMLALAGKEPAELVTALKETDPGRLVETYLVLADRWQWRNAFVSFGTCDAQEPAGTLAELGLFPADLIDSTEGLNG